jgi:hypothetical protein
LGCFSGLSDAIQKTQICLASEQLVTRLTDECSSRRRAEDLSTMAAARKTLLDAHLADSCFHGRTALSRCHVSPERKRELQHEESVSEMLWKVVGCCRFGGMDVNRPCSSIPSSVESQSESMLQL